MRQSHKTRHETPIQTKILHNLLVLILIIIYALRLWVNYPSLFNKSKVGYEKFWLEVWSRSSKLESQMIKQYNI